MTVVLDASVIIKWVFADRAEESHSVQALQILHLIEESRLAIVQPPHWLAEVAAVITRLDAVRVRRAVSLLHALELPIRADVEVYQKACDLSASLRQHVFDTLYHAVALHESEAILVTADERYYRQAQRIGRIVRLQDFTTWAR
ncbi:MAG: type II toxin-antitoxin system VapC family toxin [Nitrospira sp.]|nr:type II toxin-antitoxin system VapC family toxin [Nitrospira sp.]MDH4356877.1 type II toxin-antitoxin system VapC family toxin [Nitrospira sp.]MDH5320074.1 type II toxin-antitoxin system VapC family toxin [Nitrospira sp.]